MAHLSQPNVHDITGSEEVLVRVIPREHKIGSFSTLEFRFNDEWRGHGSIEFYSRVGEREIEGLECLERLVERALEAIRAKAIEITQQQFKNAAANHAPCRCEEAPSGAEQ